MATEDKLKYFYDSTVTALKNKTEKEIDAMKAKLSEELESYKKTHTKELENQERLQEDEIKRELLKSLASEKLALRRSQARKESIIKDKLFTEVGEVLDEIRKTDEYTDALKDMITGIKEFAGEDEVVIYLCPSDAQLKDALEKETGIELKVSEVPFNGGVQAEIPSRNIFINDSFSSRMEEARKAYTVKV